MTIHPVLVLALLLLVGVIATLLERRRHRRVPAQPAVRPSSANTRHVVRFEYADGTFEGKRLFSHSVLPTIPWRGREFDLSHIDGDTLVYREAVIRG